MMVHATSGLAAQTIETALPFACGLHYCALWWEQENARRQLNALGKIPEIILRRPGSSISPAQRTL